MGAFGSNHPYFSGTAALRTRNLRATSHTSGCRVGAAGGDGPCGVSLRANDDQPHVRAPRHAPMLTGAPYLAEEVFDRSQTLPTEHTSRKERALRRYFGIWRENSDRGSLVPEHRQRCRRSDCSGDQRLRQRFPMYLSQGTMSRIASPPPTRLLRRFILPERAPTMNSRATSSVADQPKSLSLQMNRPEHTTAPLGSQVIEGVYAEGKEITTTGNDRPLASVTELRFSPDSKVNVLSKTSDPHSGEFSTRLQNINCPTPMVAPRAVLFSRSGLG